MQTNCLRAGLHFRVFDNWPHFFGADLSTNEDRLRERLSHILAGGEKPVNVFFRMTLSPERASKSERKEYEEEIAFAQDCWGQYGPAYEVQLGVHFEDARSTLAAPCSVCGQ